MKYTLLFELCNKADIMEAEDPISGKFRTMIEALMIKTTSEIVKAFADAMLETRMEISRSWREIDHLRHVLEQKEKQQTIRTFKNQVTFKTEEDDVLVSQQIPAILGSTERRVSGCLYTPFSHLVDLFQGVYRSLNSSFSSIPFGESLRAVVTNQNPFLL